MEISHLKNLDHQIRWVLYRTEGQIRWMRWNILFFRFIVCIIYVDLFMCLEFLNCEAWKIPELSLFQVVLTQWGVSCALFLQTRKPTNRSLLASFYAFLLLPFFCLQYNNAMYVLCICIFFFHCLSVCLAISVGNQVSSTYDICWV